MTVAKTTPEEAPQNRLIINLDDITTLATEGGKLIYTPTAEDAIVGLLELEEIIHNHIEMIKMKIASAGKKLDPNFKGVVGEKVKSIYRSYGEKYSWDGGKSTPKEVLKEVTTIKIDSKAVENYVKKHDKLPEGITEKERVPVLSLTRIEYEPIRAIE